MHLGSKVCGTTLAFPFSGGGNGVVLEPAVYETKTKRKSKYKLKLKLKPASKLKHP